jgi:hypothetical protein
MRDGFLLWPERNWVRDQAPPIPLLAHPPARQLALHNPMHLESEWAVDAALVGLAGEQSGEVD